MLYFGSIMMKRETIAIADIYVPIKRRATLEQKRVDEIAASILDKGLQSPILVRVDGARFVLVEGCTGWRPLRRLAKRPSSASLSTRGSTDWLGAFIRKSSECAHMAAAAPRGPRLYILPPVVSPIIEHLIESSRVQTLDESGQLTDLALDRSSRPVNHAQA